MIDSDDCLVFISHPCGSPPAALRRYLYVGFLLNVKQDELLRLLNALQSDRNEQIQPIPVMRARRSYQCACAHVRLKTRLQHRTVEDVVHEGHGWRRTGRLLQVISYQASVSYLHGSNRQQLLATGSIHIVNDFISEYQVGLYRLGPSSK